MNRESFKKALQIMAPETLSTGTIMSVLPNQRGRVTLSNGPILRDVVLPADARALDRVLLFRPRGGGQWNAILVNRQTTVDIPSSSTTDMFSAIPTGIRWFTLFDKVVITWIGDPRFEGIYEVQVAFQDDYSDALTQSITQGAITIVDPLTRDHFHIRVRSVSKQYIISSWVGWTRIEGDWDSWHGNPEVGGTGSAEQLAIWNNEGVLYGNNRLLWRSEASEIPNRLYIASASDSSDHEVIDVDNLRTSGMPIHYTNVTQSFTTTRAGTLTRAKVALGSVKDMPITVALNMSGSEVYSGEYTHDSELLEIIFGAGIAVAANASCILSMSATSNIEALGTRWNSYASGTLISPSTASDIDLSFSTYIGETGDPAFIALDHRVSFSDKWFIQLEGTDLVVYHYDEEVYRFGGGGEATALDDLTDVNAPSPANNDALTWDSVSGRWIPEAIPPVTLAASAQELLDITTQELSLDSKAVGFILAGPLSGAVAAPTFKALSHVAVSNGLGKLLFTPTDGLLLLGPGCPRSTTTWDTLRAQRATLSGAYHEVLGRWPQSRALMVEAAATNLITNPSLETNTTGWATLGTNTIAQSTEQARYGDYSLKCTYQDTVALVDYAITLTAAAHTYSVYVYIPGAYDGTQLAAKFTGFTSATGSLTTNLDMTRVNQWQRVIVDGTPDGGDLAGLLRIREDGSAPTAGRYIYIDGADCTVGAVATTHVDGTLGTGYAWTGTAHASTSTRAATTVTFNPAGAIDLATGSIAIWFQMPYDAGTTVSVTRGLFQWWDAYNTESFYLAFNADLTTLSVLSYTGSASQLTLAVSLTGSKAGDWHHVVVTMTTNDVNLYLDGALKATDTSYAAPTIVSTSAVIGQATVQFGGAIDEFASFGRVLTADEIATIYALGKPLTDTGAFSTPVINARDVRIPYGHTYGNEIAWAQANAVQNTWYDISDADMVSGNLNLVTHDGNGQLTVLVAGMYNVDWSGAFEASAANVHIQVTVAVNGTEDLSALNHFEAVGVSRQDTASGFTILSLAANDTVELAMRTTDAGTPNLGIDHLMLRVTMVGG